MSPFRSFGSAFLFFPLGGDERDRTDDPLLAKQVLSQLSYTPIQDALRTSKIKQRLLRFPLTLEFTLSSFSP